MVIAEREDGTWYLPTMATEVRDVCGAGDTVLVTLGTGMLAGLSLREACRIALASAARQVAVLGISVITGHGRHGRLNAEHRLRPAIFAAPCNTFPAPVQEQCPAEHQAGNPL